MSAPTDLSSDRRVRSVVQLLRPYRGRVVVALIFFVAKDLPVWVMPLLTAQVIDLVVSRGSIRDGLVIAAVGAAVLLSNYPTSMAFIRLSSAVFRELAARLRMATADSLQTLSIGFHARTSASVLQSKLIRDVENIELMLGGAVPAMLSGVGVLVGALVVTALQVPIFVAVFAATIPASALLLVSVRRASHRYNEGFRMEVEGLSRTVGEMASLMPITRAHGLEAESARRIADGAERVRQSGRRLDLLNGRFTVSSWITYQLLGLGCLIGSALASITGVLPITAGQVVLLSTYFALLTGAIVQILGLVPLFAKGTESVRSLGEVFEEPDREQNEGKAEVGEVTGGFRFDHVGVRYPGARSAALDDIELTVEPGQTVAMVGTSGSGKSTVLNLILGFTRPSAGRILLDGVDMEDLDLRSYRRFVAVVPQDPVLFDATVRENIAYGLGEVSDAAVEQALADANALEFVTELPEGWNSPVGDRGSTLSGGQRQRLAIARALIRNPRVLILDEATSALDSESEALVNQALRRLVQGRTTFMVAHRLSTVRTADVIVVLRNGRIVERGDHDGLMKIDGAYRRLHEEWAA